ncbi:hypothetical protein AGOR_G00032770 [Albula goreensis]|uniref:Uncharacterized protein n=1 Tax=Albula goreensis TaxID=1534307 RepID=A0A8T3E313_9TELE|nr:hypothetical protein AGOR_G00032770 [Albula goreensis]
MLGNSLKRNTDMGQCYGLTVPHVHAANGSDHMLRLCYRDRKMNLEDLTVNAGAEVGATGPVPAGKVSAGTGLKFVRKENTGFYLIPPNDYIDCHTSKDVYITVYTVDPNQVDICDPKRQLLENIKVPPNTSIIFTKNGGYKFAKPGQIWEDGEGESHKPKNWVDVCIGTHAGKPTDKGVQSTKQQSTRGVQKG